MLLKKSMTNNERAIFDSYQTVSWTNILRRQLFLNQYCSETPLKIFFQRHRSKPEPLVSARTSGSTRCRTLVGRAIRWARARSADIFTSGRRGAFSAMRGISAAPQSRPWSARHDGIARSVRQEGRRYPRAPPCNRQRPFFVAGDRQGFATR
jgi:hypothetical protein